MKKKTEVAQNKAIAAYTKSVPRKNRGHAKPRGTINRALKALITRNDIFSVKLTAGRFEIKPASTPSTIDRELNSAISRRLNLNKQDLARQTE